MPLNASQISAAQQAAGVREDQKDMVSAVLSSVVANHGIAANIPLLDQTISGPSVGEVQAISDKVDALLAALTAAGLMPAS